MQVYLKNTQSPNISPKWVIVSSSSTLSTSFNLTSVPLGFYDIVLTWPDGSNETFDSVLEVSEKGNGMLYLPQDLEIHTGAPYNFDFEVSKSTKNLFVTLAKTSYPYDPHWSWDSSINLIRDGTIVASSNGNQDQIIQVSDPEPGPYTLSVTSTRYGKGILGIYNALPEMPDGKWIVDPVYRPYGSTYHQIMVPADSDSLMFNAEAMGDWSHFRVYQGQWGSGQQWISSSGPGASLTISNSPSGLYVIQFLDTQMISGGDQKREVMLKASTSPSAEPPPVYFPSISSITPLKGGNTGNVTLTVRGAWLDANASLSLVQASFPDIVAEKVIGNDKGTEIEAKYNLKGAQPGDYDVQVVNPNGLIVTSKEKFSLEELIRIFGLNHWKG